MGLLVPLAGCTTINLDTFFEGPGQPRVVSLHGHRRAEVFDAVIKVTREHFTPNLEDPGAGAVLTGFLKEAGATSYEEVAETHMRKCRVVVEEPTEGTVILKLRVEAYRLVERRPVYMEPDLSLQSMVLDEIQYELTPMEDEAPGPPGK